MYRTFFICSSVGGHLACFHILPIVNSTAMNIEVDVSFQISVFVFLDIYQGVELLGHMVVLFLVFSQPSILFSTVAAPIYIPTNSVQGFPFLHFVICVLFDDSHSDRCLLHLHTRFKIICSSSVKNATHCGFHLHFPDD